jgi:transposase
MKQPHPPIIELGRDELEAILQRAKAGPLRDEDCAKLQALIESYAYITELLEGKKISLDRLRKLLFGSRSEKTRDVVPPGDDAAAEDRPPTTDQDGRHEEPAAKRRGHGRNGAEDYPGAQRVAVPHASLRSGDSCPDCKHGTVYDQAQPGVRLRIVGRAPVQAQVYELQKLRCGLCGRTFTTELPRGVGPEKYDATVGSMIALLKYGTGLPFYRLEGLQQSLGIPLPASTQWDIVQTAAQPAVPAYDELIRQAAQGEVVHNDDTGVKILEFMGKRAQKAAAVADLPDGPPENLPPQRHGLFTSGIISTNQGHRIALFFSGRQHAGENLADVLAQRAAELGPPIQMCDALSRNLPAELKTILANCLAHGRREFVDLAGSFPDECRHVLEALREVYKNDALARQQNLSPQERLRFHQSKSKPIMGQLKTWLAAQFTDRLVEPNSALGKAITYLLKHWEALTLFLRKPGAPLDNNIVERALKKSILHRKNSLFYKTQNGARVGDMFMSLIYTCELCRADPFDYLTELQRHAEDLRRNPEQWMPWNYRETLQRLPAGTHGPSPPSDAAR